MTEIIVARSRAELADALRPWRATGGTVGLVPTMGALHQGHASLIETALAQGSDAVVVSVFVNPLQFAPGEDLDRYPRTFEADVRIAADKGAHVVFAPAPEELYPAGVQAGSSNDAVWVEPGPLGSILEGVSRPTHFRGVLTVVTKLFGLVQPDLAVFGEKDYQQLTLIRHLVRDLCLPVRVIGAPTIREDDGLALSSRNRFLSVDERTLALALSGALRAGGEAAAHGPEAVLSAARTALLAVPGIDLDYLELTSPSLGAAPSHGPARLLVAAKVGATRLIDNTGLDLSQTGGDLNQPRSITCCAP